MSRAYLLSVALCVAGLAGGCEKEVQKQDMLSGDGAAETRKLDYAVFDVVLSDLLKNREFEPVVDLRKGRKTQIVVSEETCEVTNRMLDTDWPGLEKAIPLELRVDLVRRNPRGRRYSLQNYHPSSPNVLVRKLSEAERDFEFETAFPEALGYVVTSLPGYSQDRQRVAVRFFFGPAPHGAAGYYLLRKAGGQWEIVAHEFAYYD